MKVLLLSPYPWRIIQAFKEDTVTMLEHKVEQWPDVDWVVSYGYRHIIPPHALQKYGSNIINLHIGYLPFNRGSDPNFWSWYDDTPKGFALHVVDQGLDTGPIIARGKVELDRTNSLRTSYNQLQQDASLTFRLIWPLLRMDGIEAVPQEHGGSYHRKSDKDRIFPYLPKGWDTPVVDIERMGKEARGQTIDSVS